MRALKGLTVFSFGGLAYGLLEIIWRGQTHISMFFVGGLCFLLITLIDGAELFSGAILLEAPVCAFTVTAIELVSGLIVNVGMDLSVWDYSSLPLNLWGQICLPFSAMWLALSVPAIFAGRILGRVVFCEPLPDFRLLPPSGVPAER